MQGLANEISSLGWDMIIILTEDLNVISTAYIPQHLQKTYHQQFTLNIPRSRKTIIIFTMGKSFAVNIRGKVTHTRLDPSIQGTAIG